MPSAISDSSTLGAQTGITKFTNCLLVRDNQLVTEDLWISTITGKILKSQEVFYGNQAAPDRIIDLGGRIIAPGFIDAQLNGAFGFDFSQEPESSTAYIKGLRSLNRNLIKTGVTSYTPTVTSQKAELYKEVVPHLGPSGELRDPTEGAESLGAHLEGPFLNPTKNGIHSVSVLRDAPTGFADLEACYGATNLLPHKSPIKYITMAPELPGAMSNIAELKARGISVSIGHSEATYEEACAAVSAGATMITHLFNAMRPLHHRNPGIFGLLGTESPSLRKPFFGVIADGIHLHSTSVKIAWNAHPDGMILVTDAMSLVGLPDGTYDWTNGSRIVKRGALLTLEENEDKIAGSSITLVGCVNNFLNWTGASIPDAIKAVTSTPARMLGLEGKKGSLEPGADADLVVLTEDVSAEGLRDLRVEQVWKFGNKVHE
ncbi:N-acetylglucosamine-6-phosphate deacetylase [Pseudovirgaria hyperparasitica]|uniref:N-acetylglucosamine-6-phosphate deacetylase n=1 Tax=Pseudovirgaria hyperparasitica TaxID=470096 RepID=A0A6A6WH30_9PEZI|nr:N-acetylglucosamine-6-phosphate deacetylase [Pseudovirgaria hyperparasitica]KAF2761395.1 N-acetylglucosamine-6-phosphate deacetylase [Pseudovirgaria hyperparasitica]